MYFPLFLHGTETAPGHHAPLSGTGPLVAIAVAVALLCLVVAVAVVLTRESGDEPRERDE